MAEELSLHRSTARWWTDLAIAVALVCVFAAFRPLMADGDGQGHADRATQAGWFPGMSPKHLLYSPLLHVVFVALDAVDLRREAIPAFTIVSNLAGALIYLLLARAIFPKFVPTAGVSQLAALGTVLTYGVMSRSCAIETYSLALMADALLVAICLNWDLSTCRGGVAAGLAFAFAVGIHSTNVLMFPFVVVILYNHASRRSFLTAGWFLITVAIAATLLAIGALVKQGASLWPLDWRMLIPQADPEPTMPFAQRLQRTAYGIARTFAWLPPRAELTATYAIAYAVGFAISLGLIGYVACHGLLQEWRRYRKVWILMAVLAIPYIVLGVYYYPSDPERWLFLMPPFWLVVALAWVEYRPAASGWLSPKAAFRLLSLVVFAMAATNVVFVLAPEARSSRELAGMHRLLDVGKAGDLVISPMGTGKFIEDYILLRTQPYETLDVYDVMRAHKGDPAAGQADLRKRIETALRENRRVLVFSLIDEKLQPGEGYPWSYVANDGYVPETILSVLREFPLEEMVKPTAENFGIFVLRRK